MVFLIAKCFPPAKSTYWQASALSFQRGRDEWNRTRSVSDGMRINRDKDPARNRVFREEQRSYPDPRAEISKWSLIFYDVLAT